MSSLEILNKLPPEYESKFQFSKNGGDNWERTIPGSLVEYPGPVVNYGFRISEGRIHDSSIALSLKGFTHTVELVDKCQGPDNFVLLRFMPKPDESVDTPDISAEGLSERVCASNNTYDYSYDVVIQFQDFRYSRKAFIEKRDGSEVTFKAQYSCRILNEDIPIGKLSPNEILEKYIEGNRPKKKTTFIIIPGKHDLEMMFNDNNDCDDCGDPHIEAIVKNSPHSPETVNITIKGDET